MRAALGLGMTARHFPPPWTVEETDACFIVRDANGQAHGSPPAIDESFKGVTLYVSRC